MGFARAQPILRAWYDPKGSIDPQEFADMVVDLFLTGFASAAAARAAATSRRARVG